MSLINRMLQDLEKRQASDTPPDNRVSIAPAARLGTAGQQPKLRKSVMAMAVAGLALSAAAYFYPGQQAVEPVRLLSAEASSPPPAAPVVEVPATPVAPVAHVEPVAPVAPVESVAPVEPVVPAQPPVATGRPVLKLSAPPAPQKRAVKNTRRASAKGKAVPASPRKPQTAALSTEKKKEKPALVEKINRQPAGDERAEQAYRDAVNHLRVGRSAEGRDALKRTLALEPGHIAARQLLVRDLMEQKAYDQARQALTEGVQQQPEQIRWYSLLARLELERGDVVAARKAVDAGLPRATDKADFLGLAGNVAQRQGKPAEAADFYRAALRLAPGEGRWWIGLGLALEADAHAPEAREAFRRAVATGSLSDDLAAYAERHAR